MGEAGRIIWVSQDGDDSNSGSSPSDALYSLSAALDIHVPGDEIFLIRQGRIYYRHKAGYFLPLEKVESTEKWDRKKDYIVACRVGKSYGRG